MPAPVALLAGGEPPQKRIDISNTVKLMRGGKEVASFVADGPRCLLKAPSGTYNVRATYQGRTKNMTVSTNSKNAQMRW